MTSFQERVSKLKHAEAKTEAERKNLKAVVEATEVRATQTELSKRAIEGMDSSISSCKLKTAIYLGMPFDHTNNVE